MIARIWYGYTTPENADAYGAMSLDSVASSCCVGQSAKKSSLQL